MKVILEGSERALRILLSKERIWLSRNGIKIAANEAEEVNPEVDETPNKEDQSIMFDNLKAKKIGDTAFNLEAASTSELPIVFASSDETIAKIEDGRVVILKDGKVTITASQSGNDKFNTAEDVAHELVIKKKGLLG